MNVGEVLFEISLFPASGTVSQKALNARADAIRQLIYQLPLPPAIIARFDFGFRSADGFLWMTVMLGPERQMPLFRSAQHHPSTTTFIRSDSTLYAEKSVISAWEEAHKCLQRMASRARLSPAELIEMLPLDPSHSLDKCVLDMLRHQPKRRLQIRVRTREITLEFPDMALRWTHEDTTHISAKIHMVGRCEASIYDVRCRDNNAALDGLGRKKISLFWNQESTYASVSSSLHAAILDGKRVCLTVRETRCRLTEKLDRLELVNATTVEVSS